MELDSTGGPVDLTDPGSFALGQPWESYRWLREHDPVHFHPETDGPVVARRIETASTCRGKVAEDGRLCRLSIGLPRTGDCPILR
jgi:hypothetical protein